MQNKLNSLILLTAFMVSSCASGASQSESKINVIDMVGDEVVVPKNPTKVACVSRTTYDLLVAFGLGNRVDGVYKNALNPWSEVVYPESGNTYKYEYEPSYELLLSRGVDLVFSPEKYITDSLRNHGINALTVSLYGTPSFDGYVTFFSSLVASIWDDASVIEKARAWEKKVLGAVSEIKSEISKHEPEARTLFYVRGDKDKGIGYTDQKGSFTEYAYRMLGFEFLGASMDTNKPSAEAICQANPDVFVLGGPYQHKHAEELYTQEPYKNLEAVKAKQVYTIPVGLTMFEQLSAMTPVFFYDQANKLYPEWFHYDISELIKETVAECFATQLSDAQVDYMIEGLGPNGGSLA